MVAVRFSAVGDVALTTGVLLHWHQTQGLIFTVVTRKIFAPLFEHNPAVCEVIGLTDEDLRGRTQITRFRAIAGKYKDSPLINLHRNLRSALLSRFWHNTVLSYEKLSLDRRIFLWSRGRFRGSALRASSVPQRYAGALYAKEHIPSAEALRPRIFLTEDELHLAKKALLPIQNGNTPLVALHPFAAHAAKTWHRNIWLELSERLRDAGIRCFWVGKGEALPKTEAHADFVNKTDLRQLCALLSQADALVTGDSGPLHLAAGVNTPVLAMFGPTCREWGFFPCGPHDKIIQLSMPCRPCSLHGSGTCPQNNSCISKISTEMVLQKLKTMLS